MTSTLSWKSLQRLRSIITCEIAREYGISESMVRKWSNQQHVLFSGELQMTAKRASMGLFRLKYAEMDQQLADWFSDQWSQGKHYWVYFSISSNLEWCACHWWSINLFMFIVFDQGTDILFLLLQVCQLAAWFFESRQKNSAPSLNLKHPMAGTRTAQQLPADMEDRVIQFHWFVLRSHQRWGYDLSCILNIWAASHQNLGVQRE